MSKNPAYLYVLNILSMSAFLLNEEDEQGLHHLTRDVRRPQPDFYILSRTICHLLLSQMLLG